MKKLLMFSLVAAAFLAACQPKDANTTAAATTTASVATPAPTPEAAAAKTQIYHRYARTKNRKMRNAT